MSSADIPVDETITVTIECHTDPGTFHFDVSSQMSISQFLQQVLSTLAQGEHAKRVKNMQNYYEPVLELCAGKASLPLDSSMTLAQAGIENKSVCRIAAKPLKERIMFCNNG